MSVLELTDEQIALRIKSGDKKIFEVIVDRYLEKIKRYARKFIFDRNDIDDLVQDVFLKVYINIQSFDENRKFSSWIYRIAHNEFVNAIKKRMYQKLFSVDFDTFFPHPEAKENIEEDRDKVFTEKILDEHLEQLDPKYREVIVLYFFEDMDYKQISEILEIPTSTVGVRLARAKERLKNLIGEQIL